MKYGLVLSPIIAFTTTHFVLNKEKKQGVLIVYELIERYFRSVWESISNGEVLNDKLTKAQYLRVIIQVEQTFLDLRKNRYYHEILKKYPSIVLLQVQLSREISEHLNSTTFSLNEGSIIKFYEFYKIVKQDIPNGFLENIELNNHIDEFIRVNKLMK